MLTSPYSVTQQLNLVYFSRFERVAFLIFEQSSSAECEDAKTILGWIICAKRLVRWREIQALFCIDPVDGTVDYEVRRLSVSCKELCGSLIDVHHLDAKPDDPESYVEIVHETAREYLIRKKSFDLSLESSKLAIFCCQYLTSRPFKSGVNEDEIVSYASVGYYSLLDYAVQHWYGHLQDCVTSTSSLEPEQFRETMDSAAESIKMYNFASTLGQPEEVSETIKRLPEDSRKRYDRLLSLGIRISMIRKGIETAQERTTISEPTALEIFANLQGAKTRYKCPKPWCDYFLEGFGDPKDRESHVNRHDLPYHCSVAECFGSRLGFHTQERLEIHKRNHHPVQEVPIEFPTLNTKNDRFKFRKAIHSGDLATLKAMSISGDSRNLVRKQDLIQAVTQGHFSTCKFLLEEYARLGWEGVVNNRPYPLHVATRLGHVDIVQLLLDQKLCQPDIEDGDGRFPISHACENGNLEIVKLLWDTGRFNDKMLFRSSKYREYRTPLECVCIGGHLDIIRYFVHNGESYLVTDEVLEITIQFGDSDTVDFLLSLGIAPLNSFSAVEAALKKHNTGLAITILKSMSDERRTRSGADHVLQLCIQTGRKDMVDLILSVMPDNPSIGFSYGSIVSAALQSDSADGVDIAMAILQYMNSRRHPERLVSFTEDVLKFSAQTGRKDIVELLLSMSRIELITCSSILAALQLESPDHLDIAKSIVSYMDLTKSSIYHGDQALKDCKQLAEQHGWGEVLDALQGIETSEAAATFRSVDLDLGNPETFDNFGLYQTPHAEAETETPSPTGISASADPQNQIAKKHEDVMKKMFPAGYEEANRRVDHAKVIEVNTNWRQR